MNILCLLVINGDTQLVAAPDMAARLRASGRTRWAREILSWSQRGWLPAVVIQNDQIGFGRAKQMKAGEA